MRKLLSTLVLISLVLLLAGTAAGYLGVGPFSFDGSDPNGYVLIVGVILSVVARWFPGISKSFDALDDEKKQLIMLGILFAVVAARFGLGCAGQDNLYACTGQGAYSAFSDFILAMMSNVGTYRATKYIQADEHARLMAG